MEMVVKYLNCGWYDGGPEFLVLILINLNSHICLVVSVNTVGLYLKKNDGGHITSVLSHQELDRIIFLNYKEAESLDRAASAHTVFPHRVLLSLEAHQCASKACVESTLSPEPNGPSRILSMTPLNVCDLYQVSPAATKLSIRRGKSIPKSLWTLFQRQIEISQNNKKLILHHALPLTYAFHVQYLI